MEGTDTAACDDDHTVVFGIGIRDSGLGTRGVVEGSGLG